MSVSFIEAYYDSKINNVLEYLKCILKSIEEKKYMNVTKYSKVIQKYILDGMKDKEKISDKVNDFLNYNNITHYKLKNIVNYVIKYLDSEIIVDVYSNADKMIYISKLVYLAIELETKSTVFVYPSPRYNAILDKVLSENKKMFSKEEIEKLTESKEEIESILKQNIKNQKEFVKKTSKSNFKICINTLFSDDDKKINFYDYTFDYNVPSIKKYTEKEINESIEKYDINLQFKKVEIQLLELEVLKLLFKEKEDFKIFLKVNDEELEDASFIKLLFEKFNIEKFRNHVVLLVDNLAIKRNKVLIESFSDSMIKIATKGIKEFSGNYSYFRFIDYVLIDANDMKLKEYKEFVQNAGLNSKVIEI